ncbi:uncharacterized protein FOBCDRAFT_203399 [Fusarium oxysporum Fo47]|uniref:Uncharacterized protein n=1 Tax=Fusarium oxysporum Fo47 TaxID=660027 RepID=W9KCH3_FUSOX|nr:uncharacterized protein FOBCDRAFT_203399 [Fusarium oxysporum Fo47]EWZ40419.1 hypothetical protein FOZG_09108 [Fusarium oxysporum Fo47]QKD56324.2 hypothetical protein FOBCDRAFT_203399 [Fusarium oxysporum Fo47]
MAGVVALTETSSHLEMVLWADEENLRRTAHSTIFRNNLTKYLGVHSKVVRGPELFFHEPRFWLDEINNNNNTKILRSKIANSNSGSGETTVGSDIQEEGR